MGDMSDLFGGDGNVLPDARYEVRLITLHGEKVLASFDQMDDAFDDSLARWARKTASSVFAVRDTETEQRWSYADIKELRQPQSQGGKP